MPDLVISPKSVALTVGQTQQFEALGADGKPVPDVTWSIQPTQKAGEIEPDSGIYIAPSWIVRNKKAVIVARKPGFAPAVAAVELIPVPFWTQALGLYLLLVFVGLLGLLVWSWDWLCPACKPAKVRVSPPVVTLMPSQAQAFTANVPVSWPKNQLVPGLYTAPARIPPGGKIQVIAQSQEDPTKTGAAEIFLSATGGLTLAPSRTALGAGGSVDLTAVLTSPTPPSGRAGTGGVTGDSAANDQTPRDSTTQGSLVDWMSPEIGTLTAIGEQGLTARFSAPANAVDRPTTVLVLARTREASPRIAGAWVTVQPASLLTETCGDGYDYNAARLLLLLAIMGALGGIIHGISSFTTYVGNREFLTSWVWWYIFKPFLAGLVALIVFLVFRAGFGVGDFALGAADCLKAAAFAALIGLFAEPATLKLKDIFDTLFTPRNDPRRDAAGQVRKSGPTLVSLDPARVTVGQSVQTLTLNGTGFAPECQVKIGGAALKKPSSATTTKLVVPLEGDDIFKKAGTVEVTVYNKPPDGDPSNTLTIEVAAAEGGGNGGVGNSEGQAGGQET